MFDVRSLPESRTRLIRCAAFIAVCAGGVLAAAQPQPSEPVIRVEEDWELVLNEPNDAMTTPQFHTVMSPFPHVDSYYALVIWNYRETPGFVPGGVQLQAWNGDSVVRRRTMDYGSLSTAAETITWTQVLTTDGVALTFSVENGQSTTWGPFGRDMRVDYDANLSSLDGYSSAATVENSWITYGSNRVDSLRIVQVRRYGPNGLLSVDSEPKVVFELED